MTKKQDQPTTEKPLPSTAPPKPMEIARSGPMDLRALRQLASSMYVTIQQFSKYQCIQGKEMVTARDIASEYNWILSEIDSFYSKARNGIGNPKVYLVAESEGFTKQMEISIKEKEPEQGTWVAEWRDNKVSLAK